MKLANGYGNISKLTGNRRRPWRVRLTVGWDIDSSTNKAKQLYKTIGYFKTQAEAIKALSDYHTNPYSLDSNITFKELYDKWSQEKFDNISRSNVNGYKASYAVCGSLYNMPFVQIRKNHLQSVVDSCGKNYPTLRKLKVLFNQLYKYAIENDICQKDYSQFVDIVKHKEKSISNKHKMFSESEINLLWENVSRNEYLQIILIMIYSGVRISELLDLKKDNVYLSEGYFDIIASKTEAGIRKVPIANKIIPFIENWLSKDCEYLICTPANKHITYKNYIDAYWAPLINELNMNHLPHDTRHTTISLLAQAGVSQTIIKMIVGHSGAMSLTEKVYTHFEIQQLIDAINKI